MAIACFGRLATGLVGNRANGEMAQATEYNRQANFRDIQTLAPASPTPGGKLDDEFNAIKLTTDELRERNARIQRDDGQLANQIVGRDQLRTEVQLGLNTPRVWRENLAFFERDTTLIGEKFYICLISHTSSTTFSADLALSRWEMLADFTFYSQQVLDAGAAAVAAVATTAASAAAALASELEAEAARDSANGHRLTAQNAAGTATTAQNATIVARDATFVARDTVLDAGAAVYANPAFTGVARFNTYALLYATSSGEAVFAENLTYDVSTGLFKVAQSGGLGWAALKLYNGVVQTAGVAGAVTAGATVTPTWRTMADLTSVQTLANKTLTDPIGTITRGATSTATGVASIEWALPAGVHQIELNFRALSWTGTGDAVIQLGTAASWLQSGYRSQASLPGYGVSGGVVASYQSRSSSVGFIMLAGGPADQHSGRMNLSRVGANGWVGSGGAIEGANSLYNQSFSGDVDLGAEITRIRILNNAGDSIDVNAGTGIIYGR